MRICPKCRKAASIYRIESIIHKMSKARDKYPPGCRNYKRFDPTVQVMEQVRMAILEALNQ